MSADNEIAILHLKDKAGNQQWWVADNVSMSYNTLPIDIDLKDKEQLEMVYHIWKDAKVFTTQDEYREYTDKLEEENYYEYGTATWHLNIDWADLVFLYRGSQK
jgi:hypothetical protein